MNQKESQREIPTLSLAEHISQASFQKKPKWASRHTRCQAWFLQYALHKCMISTILKSVLLASLLFFTAKKPNLFFVQRKSGITAISAGTDENIGKTFR